MSFRAPYVLAALVALSACEKKEPADPPTTAAQTTAPVEDRPVTAEQPPEEAGQWVPVESYGVKFRVPDDWKVKQGETSTSATSPDDTITVLVVGTEGEGVFATAIESVKKEVQFKDIKVEKDTATMVNGLAGHNVSGSAVLVGEGGDQEIQFIMNAVRATADKGVALMVFAEAEMYEARKEEVLGITKTLQRM